VTIEFFQLLTLIITANGAPVLARLLFGDKLNTAVDLGSVWTDNHPLFGASKTWRGIAAALLATAMLALFLGYSAQIGIQIAAYAIIGDLMSSFIKRRFAMPVSAAAVLLDQVPESLFPALLMMTVFRLHLVSIVWLVIIFTVIDLVVTYFLYRWRLLKKID
jgi:hypothetical protein